MLFELLTGRLPFTGDTPLSIAYQHVNADVPAPSALAPDIDTPVDQLLLAATSRDPARRPADAGEFLRAVRHVREGLPQPSGLTGVMGAGVQGLGEAPWLDLDTPAATGRSLRCRRLRHKLKKLRRPLVKQASPSRPKPPIPRQAGR